MKKLIQETGLKFYLNKSFRIPQRAETVKLSNNTVCMIETFKNKQIVSVYNDIEERFLSRI